MRTTVQRHRVTPQFFIHVAEPTGRHDAPQGRMNYVRIGRGADEKAALTAKLKRVDAQVECASAAKWQAPARANKARKASAGEFIVGRPPRSVAACMLNPVREAERAVMLQEMLKGEVIERVGSPLTTFSTQQSPGIWPVLTSIFSTYFLLVVPKSDGGWRGCLDARWLNQYVQAIYFRMESLRTLRDMVRPGDYLVRVCTL